ncbi:MAG TPA: hypothetical protein VK610_09855 [Rhodothermales bacterium]|nr:hypothetical protein [Rhodothermales bacterium]
MPSGSLPATTRLALAFGLFASGVVVGLLLAPSPGADARRRLALGARQAGRTARQAAAGAAGPVAEQARAQVGSLASRHVPLAGEWDLVDGAALRQDLRRGRL